MPKQIFVKKEAPGDWGKKPEERTPEELIQYGIVNIDKPKGPTSHQVSDYVQKILHISKAGHSGTLDPQVTGVQPVALGKATRITQFLLTAPKEYVGIMHLHKEVEEKALRETILQFTGKIKQLPPIKSAVKRQLREREIYEFEILELKHEEFHHSLNGGSLCEPPMHRWNSCVLKNGLAASEANMPLVSDQRSASPFLTERDVLFRVKCQAGTYVRKLCFDIGKVLGIGAHMAELRRTQAGPFTENDNLVTLNDLQDAYHFYKEEQNARFLRYCIQPMETALKQIAKCWIQDTTIESVTHGRDVAVPGISKLENFRKGDIVAVMTLKEELVAIGEALMSGVEINTKEKGLAVKVEKVFREVV